MCCFYEAKTVCVNKHLPREPSDPVDVMSIRQAYAGEKCPMCRSFGWLKCASCDEGQVPFLGGYQACRSCFGSGIKPCPVCERRGLIRENNHSTHSNSVQGSVHQSKIKVP